MTGTAGGLEYHIPKNRLETLIDGIFAIAMTLLVLTINLPKPSAEQAQAVLPDLVFGLFPQVFLCIIAFLILAVFWLGHHRQFHFVETVDFGLLWINIFLLIFIVLIPFSTDIAGDYPDVAIAVLSFHVNILIVGLLFWVHWLHIAGSSHLQNLFPDQATIRLWMLQTALIPSVALCAILVSFLNPPRFPAGVSLCTRTLLFPAPLPFSMNREAEVSYGTRPSPPAGDKRAAGTKKG
jgi:uncharacterized membrane protein